MNSHEARKRALDLLNKADKIYGTEAKAVTVAAAQVYATLALSLPDEQGKPSASP